jgi:hypothetical protein
MDGEDHLAAAIVAAGVLVAALSGISISAFFNPAHATSG